MKPVLIKRGAPFFGRRLLYAILYYVQIAIRLFRLHLLRYWLHPREKPKVALYHDRVVALIQSIIHLVPLSVVVAFIVINIKSWYWGDASSTVFTTLQFTAKALEILMQTSLGIIMMSFVRSQLFEDSGLPLGSLLGPYSVTDVAYLWSLEFWGGLVSKHARIGQRLVVGLVIAAFIVLASLVGPSIAVLLIPRPIDYVTGRYLQLLDEQATIFPEQVHLQGGNLTDEGAFRGALYQFLRNENKDFKFTDQYNLGRKMPSDATTPILPPLNSSSTYHEDLDGYVGTLAATLVSIAMHFPNWKLTYGSLHNYMPLHIETTKDSTRTTTFQPHVQIICQGSPMLGRQKNKYATFGNIRPEITNITFADLEEIMYWSEFDNIGDSHGITGNRYGIAWFDAPLQASNHSILMATGAQGLLLTNSTISVFQTCVIDAVWLKTNMNSAADGNEEIVINSELLPVDRQQFSYQPIKFSADWASRVADISLENQSDFTRMQPGKIFALALANAAPIPQNHAGIIGWRSCPTHYSCGSEPLLWLHMSQTQYDAAKAYLESHGDILSKHDDVFFYTSSNWSNPGSLYHLEVETYRQGYGYDSSSVPVILSLIVLSIYSLVVVMHLLYTFATGNVGRSWDTLAELLLLGLHSQPPELAATSNTTVGIETMAPFEEPVGVRVNENGSAELLFLMDNLIHRRALGRVEANKAY